MHAALHLLLLLPFLSAWLECDVCSGEFKCTSVSGKLERQQCRQIPFGLLSQVHMISGWRALPFRAPQLRCNMVQLRLVSRHNEGGNTGWSCVFVQ
jgi:hypothetical protein